MFTAHLLLEALKRGDGRSPVALQPVQPHQAPPGMLGQRTQGDDLRTQRDRLRQVAPGLQQCGLAGPALDLSLGDALARMLQPAVDFVEWTQVATCQQFAFGQQRISQQIDRDTAGQLQHGAGFDRHMPGAAAQLKQPLTQAQADLAGRGGRPQPGADALA